MNLLYTCDILIKNLHPSKTTLIHSTVDSNIYRIKIIIIMKLFIYIFFTLMTLSVQAKTYTQQGIIKTKGRMLNDGSVEPGTTLPATFVTIRGGNTWESDSNGKISFPVDKDSPFYIQKVQKSGYILTDYDLLSHALKYSNSTPIYITLEKQGDKTADELAAAQKIRRTLNNKLLAQKCEADSLLAANKIAEDEYRSLLQKLLENQTAAEMLVKSMSEEYAKIDFDQVDDFNRRISSMILNGELQEADSLLSTKGDLNKDITRLNIHRKANDDIRYRLEKHEDAAYRKMMDIADRCHKKAQIHQLRFEHDSVVYYLSLRAKLDTLNLEWQKAVASHILVYQSDYDRVISLYNKALEISIAHHGENHRETAILYNDIGVAHRKAGNSKKAVEYQLRAMDILQLHPDFENIGSIYANLVITYTTLSDYECVKKYIPLCLENIPQEPISNNIACRLNAANGYYSIGDKESLLQAEKIITEALEECYKELGENHILTANSLHSLGVMYCKYALLQQNGKGVDYLTKALNIKKKIYGEKHMEIAISLLSISQSYIPNRDFAKAIYYCNEALRVMENIGLSYHPITVQILSHCAIYNYSLSDLENAKNRALQALDIQKMLYGEKHADTAGLYMMLSSIYLEMGDKSNAVDCAEKDLKISIALYGENNYQIATCYKNLGDLYKDMGKSQEALHHYSNAARIVEQGCRTNTSYLIYMGIAEIYENKKKYNEAINNYIKADDEIVAYYGSEDIHRGSIQMNLCTTYYYDGNPTKALEHAILARDIFQKHLPENHEAVVAAKEAIQKIQEALANDKR